MVKKTRREFLQAAAVLAGGALTPGIKREHILWTGSEEAFHDAPYVPGIKHFNVHRAQEGRYQYLHGPQIIWFKGILYTSWANSLVNENSNTENQRGRRSNDGGKTWSETEVIAPPLDGRWRRSHGAFAIHDNTLYAFAPKFGNACYEDLSPPVGIYEQSVIRGEEVFEALETELWKLDEKRNRWDYQGSLGINFWPTHEPRKLKNGNRFMSGMNSKFEGSIALSDGDCIDRWHVHKIPVPTEMLYGEATCWVDGSDRIEVLLRGSESRKKYIQYSESRDGGRTWNTACGTNFPHTAKPHAGILSTGQRYLINNINPSRRWPLTIAAGAPGERTLNRIWRIRDGITEQPRFPGKHKNRGWQYPCAYEQNGNLYVIYSVGKEDAELAVLPVKTLKV